MEFDTAGKVVGYENTIAEVGEGGGGRCRGDRLGGGGVEEKEEKEREERHGHSSEGVGFQMKRETRLNHQTRS